MLNRYNEEVTSSEGEVSLDPFLFVLDGDSEAFLQQRELADEVSDGVRKRFLSTTHTIRNMTSLSVNNTHHQGDITS